jgi:hypothetical protein
VVLAVLGGLATLGEWELRAVVFQFIRRVTQAAAAPLLSRRNLSSLKNNQRRNKSTAQPRSQPQAPKSNPALDYLNIPASRNPNDAVVDRALREVRKNPTPRPSRKRQRTQSEGNSFISSPLPPTKITRPKRRKDNPSIEIPKQKDQLTEITPAFPETDPFNRTIPTVPRKDPFTNATPNVRVVPQQDPFTNATPNVRVVPQQDPFTNATSNVRVVPQQDPFTNATSNVRGYPLDDQRYPNPFSTTPNPNKPSRNRRNPKKPDILRVNNRPEVEELYRKNPLIPAQKPNPNSVPPGKISSPNNGGQAVQAKKTPNNGGSQNSSSGGNSGQQQQTKKQKKALAKKYAGRDFDKLTSAEIKEIEKGYIINNRQGKKYIQRKSDADSYPPLHLAEVDGKRVIAEGKSPNARGNSSASTMKKEFKAKFGEDAPQGDNLHHLIPVNVWQKDPIVQALEKKGEKEEVPVAGVDDGNGLLSLPSHADAMEKPAKNLEQKGGRVKIAHPSSHDKWDEHVRELLKAESSSLKRDFGSLDKVPIDKLEKSIDNVRSQLRNDLQEAERKLEQGNYKNPPKWIYPKYPLKPEPSKLPISPLRKTKLYPRVVQEPTKKDVAEFRQVLAALKEKSYSSPQKHSLFDDHRNLNTTEKQARTLGYSAILAIKYSSYFRGEQFVFQRKDTEVGIYRQGDYTQIAVVDLKNGEISMNKSLNKAEHDWLANQEKIVLAQAPDKQPDNSQRGRDFEIG